MGGNSPRRRKHASSRRSVAREEMARSPRRAAARRARPRPSPDPPRAGSPRLAGTRPAAARRTPRTLVALELRRRLLEILVDGAARLLRVVPQDVGGVKRRHQQGAAVFVETTPERRDRRLAPQER